MGLTMTGYIMIDHSIAVKTSDYLANEQSFARLKKNLEGLPNEKDQKRVLKQAIQDAIYEIQCDMMSHYESRANFKGTMIGSGSLMLFGLLPIILSGGVLAIPEAGIVAIIFGSSALSGAAGWSAKLRFVRKKEREVVTYTFDDLPDQVQDEFKKISGACNLTDTLTIIIREIQAQAQTQHKEAEKAEKVTPSTPLLRRL